MVGSLPLISLLLMIIMMPVATHAQEAGKKRQPPKIEKPEKTPEKYYKNGAEILLPCKATGLPTPRYEWKKNGEDLENKTNIKHEGGNIRITDAGKAEEGYYQCRVINQHGVSLSSVFHLQMAAHPDFAEGGRPESVIKSEGDTATFRCQASPTTKPKASITWLFNGEPINVTNPGPRIELTEENQVLTINNLKRDSDISVIQCNVSNEHGYIFADAELNVLVKTEIVKAPVNQTVYENTTNVMFECQIKSDSLYPATILWTRDDKPIEEYNDTNMVLANESRQLHIQVKNVTDDDYQGQYACIAKNDYSNAKAVAYLSIHNGPEKGASFLLSTSWSLTLLAVIGCLLIIIFILILTRYTIKRNKDARVDQIPEEQPLLEQLNVGLRDIITEKIISYQDFKIQRQIGKGNFGKVFHATLIIDNQERSVALKTLKDTSKASKECISEFLEEAMIMKNFDHPNVLALIGVILTEADLYVVLPYMAHGDLRHHVARQMFDADIFMKFVLDVAEGMKYLSSQRFIHRDLAARNCMVNADGRVLIGDFGLARDIYEKDYYTPEDRRRPLPFKWMAPESLERRVFTTKSDVWSFGVTLWEIYTQGDKPYPLIHNLDILMYLERGHRLEKPPNCPDPLYNIMYLCWHKDPAERPGFPHLQNEIIQIERDMKQNKKDLIPAISTENIQHGEQSTAQSQPPRDEGSKAACKPPTSKHPSRPQYENIQLGEQSTTQSLPPRAEGSSVACKPSILKPLSRPQYENIPDRPLSTHPITKTGADVQQRQSTAVSTKSFKNKEKSTLQSMPPRVEGSSVACRPPVLNPLGRPSYENFPEQPLRNLPYSQSMEEQSRIEDTDYLKQVKCAQPRKEVNPTEIQLDINVQQGQSKASTNTQPSVALRKSNFYEVTKRNCPLDVKVIFQNIDI